MIWRDDPNFKPAIQAMREIRHQIRFLTSGADLAKGLFDDEIEVFDTEAEVWDAIGRPTSRSTRPLWLDERLLGDLISILLVSEART